MKKNPTPSKRAEECIRAWRDTGEDTDIQGSYTGFYKHTGQMGTPLYTPYDYSMMVDDLEPVQDVDDL